MKSNRHLTLAETTTPHETHLFSFTVSQLDGEHSTSITRLFLMRTPSTEKIRIHTRSFIICQLGSQKAQTNEAAALRVAWQQLLNLA